MADVNTAIYGSLGQNNQSMTPLQIIQLIGGIKQNQLMQQTIDARQGITDAYSANPNPDLATIGQKAGYFAPQIIGQQTQNTTAQSALDQSQQDVIQRRLGAVGSLPNPTIDDVTSALTSAAKDNPTIPPAMITSRLDEARALADNPKALKKWALTQGITAPSTAALTETSGPPDAATGTPVGSLAGATTLMRGGVAQPGNGMPTGLPPGFQEAASASAAQMANARNRAANYGSDMYPMTQLLGNLQQLGAQGTGPGTKELNTMKAFVQSNLSWLPGADKIIGDPNQIATYDEAAKYATQLAGSRAAQFGHGTDQAMATSLVGSPNTHISNLAGVNLTKAVIGMRRMDQAQIAEAERQGVQPGQYSQWAGKWMTGVNPTTGKADSQYAVDPRAFMIDTMDDQQKANLDKSLQDPVKRQRFNNTVQMAIKNGLIDPPNGQ